MSVDVSCYRDFPYTRDYSKDIPFPINVSNYRDRLAVAALPIFSLHPDVRKPISVIMGAVRVWNTWNKDSEILDKIVCVASVAGMFQHRVGIAITTVHDTAKEITKIKNSKDWEEASKSLVKVANNCVYLALLLYPGIDLAVLATAFQAVINLIESKDQFNNDRWIEGISHLTMAIIRLNQYFAFHETGPILQYTRQSRYFFEDIKGREGPDDDDVMNLSDSLIGNLFDLNNDKTETN